MDKLYENAETGCCPRFNPKPWQNKTIKFKNRLFVKDHIISFFHIPLNMGSVITRNMKKIKKAKALTKKPLMLSDECSMWGADIYIEATKKVPGCNMVKISGTFLTKVFEGPYSDMKKWIKKMHEFVASKGKVTKKMYFFYTMCPRCAKYYKQNYTVILAKI